MPNFVEGVPAYGRDYKTAAQVKAAWSEGKDFRDAATGQYFSVRDVETFGLVVHLRYNNLRKVVSV